MKELKQQKAKLESSAKGQDDRIIQLKVCTHVHVVLLEFVLRDFVHIYTLQLRVIRMMVKYMQYIHILYYTVYIF